MCQRETLSAPFDFGSAAVCRENPSDPAQPIPRVNFRLAACTTCGTIQLLETPDLEWLRPPGECILFREPERHLDDLCRIAISYLPSTDVRIMGLSYKDAPLLERFQRAGFSRTVLLDRTTDWGLNNPREGVETLQSRLTPSWAEKIKSQHGAADVLVVRHLIEHAHDVATFLRGCRALLAPGGWLLLETLGCESEMARGDAGALWEEHVMYFTPTSMRRGLTHHGFQTRWIGAYPYAVEDCLAAWGQFTDDTPTARSTTTSGIEILQEFQTAQNDLKKIFRETAKRTTDRGLRVALWGAGHRTATLMELMSGEGLIDCVIDDDPLKQKRYLPGSKLPIMSSEALSSRNIGLCIGLLNPDTFRAIQQRLPVAVQQQTQFLTLADLISQRRVPSSQEANPR